MMFNVGELFLSDTLPDPGKCWMPLNSIDFRKSWGHSWDQLLGLVSETRAKAPFRQGWARLYSQRIEQVLIEGLLKSCFPFCHWNSQLLRERVLSTQDRHHYSASSRLPLFPPHPCHKSLVSSLSVWRKKCFSNFHSPPTCLLHIPSTSKLSGQTVNSVTLTLSRSSSSESLPVGFHFYVLLELSWLPKAASWQDFKFKVSSLLWPCLCWLVCFVWVLGLFLVG